MISARLGCAPTPSFAQRNPPQVVTAETTVLKGDPDMLGWAIVFAVLAIIAGALGFFALAGVAAAVAKMLFLVFLVLLVVSFIMRAVRGQSVV